MDQQTFGFTYDSVDPYIMNWRLAQHEKEQLAKRRRLVAAFEVSKRQRAIEAMVKERFPGDAWLHFKERIDEQAVAWAPALFEQ